MARVAFTSDGFTLWASAADTSRWARRPGASWPCSALAGHRFVATFNRGGLVDLTVDGRYNGPAEADLTSNELTACVADLAGPRLPAGHPCRVYLDSGAA